MGVCSSCLGLGRRSSDAEPSETSRLLRQDSHHRHYGAGNEQASVPEMDPEQLRRERDALERICAQTADDLIDISHADEGSKTAADYARLFGDIFPATITSQDPPVPDTAEPENEQAWLRNIMNKDPNDRSWDCNAVIEIHKPLTFSFD